jgi:hypothetical protein
MTENSPLIGSRRGADILRSASATHNDGSVLQKEAGGRNLGLTVPPSEESRVRRQRSSDN